MGGATIANSETEGRAAMSSKKEQYQTESGHVCTYLNIYLLYSVYGAKVNRTALDFNVFFFI